MVLSLHFAEGVCLSMVVGGLVVVSELPCKLDQKFPYRCMHTRHVAGGKRSPVLAACTSCMNLARA